MFLRGRVRFWTKEGREGPKHLHRYVDEFAFRLNEGNVERHTLDRLESFVAGTAGKRLTYNRRISSNRSDLWMGAMSDNARPMPNGDRCEHKNCAAKRVCSWAWMCAHRYCPALGRDKNKPARRFVGGAVDPSGRFGGQPVQMGRLERRMLDSMPKHLLL